MAGKKEPGWQVRELYSAINEQDVDAFDRIVSEQIEFIDYGLGERVRGREAFKKYFRNWWIAFPKGTGEVRNLIASSHQVVVEVIGRGDQTGHFETHEGRIEPTNRMFEIHFCQVFQIREGLIVSGHSYSDAYRLRGVVSGGRKVA